ncbi:MAG: hypothetical protein V1748_06225 [Actinomycetota bacterium]
MIWSKDKSDPGPGGPPKPAESGDESTRAALQPPGCTKPDETGRRERNHRVLLGIGAGILAVLICGGMFAIGYVVGNRPGTTGTGLGLKGSRGGLGLRGTGQGQQAGGNAGAVQQRVQQWLDQNDATLVRGEVTGVGEGSVSVRTLEGEQTIAITGDTRVLGGGQATGDGETAGGGAGAAGDLQQGEKVVVAVRTGTGGKLEALALKKMKLGAIKQKVQQPAP